jgi:hypothetical protein
VFTNPTTPNIIDYTKFLLTGVGIPAAMLPPDFTGTGTVASGSNVLTIVTATTGALYSGAVVSDASGYIPVGDTIIQQLTGTTGGIGTYQMAGAATNTQSTPEAITAANGWIVTTLSVAQEVVNETLACASPLLYTLAVYNLAADRLINFAIDITDQTYFQDLRAQLRISDVSLGVVSSSSNETTSSSWLNPEALKNLTLQDLQMLKTEYGRTYMGIAQSYGSTIWGLS